MSNIFICYRRDDSEDVSARICDLLKHRLGRSEVFFDVDSIDPGLPFNEVLDRTVNSCEVLLVIIGKTWLGTTDKMGRRRLEDPEDHVRREIEAALNRKIPVVPVLVHEAPLPEKYHLPLSLQKLLDHQAYEIRRDPAFRGDVEQLIKKLPRLRKSMPERITKSASELLQKVTRGTIDGVSVLAKSGDEYVESVLTRNTSYPTRRTLPYILVVCILLLFVWLFRSR